MYKPQGVGNDTDGILVLGAYQRNFKLIMVWIVFACIHLLYELTCMSMLFPWSNGVKLPLSPPLWGAIFLISSLLKIFTLIVACKAKKEIDGQGP